MPRSKAVAQKKDKISDKPKKLTSQKIARKSAPVQTGVKQKRKSKPGKLALR